jgi:hypothetical protein
MTNRQSRIMKPLASQALIIVSAARLARRAAFPVYAGAAAGWLVAAALAGAAAPARAADVGVSVSVSQPGVYGRIDIGRFPQPQVVVQQPVLVVPTPRHAAPVYVYAPPGHRKQWKQHCGRYGACNVPVYFVTDRWYRQRVQPYLVAYPAGAWGHPPVPHPGPRYGHWHDPRRDARPGWGAQHGRETWHDRHHRDGDERRFRGPVGHDR